MSVDTLTRVGTTISQKVFCSFTSVLNPDQQLKRGLLRTDVGLFVCKSWVHGGSIANPDGKYFLGYICFHRHTSIILVIWYLWLFPPSFLLLYPPFPSVFISLPSLIKVLGLGVISHFPLQITFTLLFPSLWLLPHFNFLDQERQTSLERTSLQNSMIRPDHSPQLIFRAPYTPALLVYLF